MSPAVEQRLDPEDRRSAQRYPIDAELCYQLRKRNAIQASGRGRTVNISSSGILFRPMRSVPAGAEIELSIAWPARIDGIVRMQLKVTGLAVRTQDDCIGLHIVKHEFRTGEIHESSVSSRRAAARRVRP